MKHEKIEMPVVNSSAAGIDIGSRSHFVAIGQGEKHVREYGVYAQDLIDLTNWLVKNKITTVAMESTGDYWQNLYVELIKQKIDVYLVNGKFTKTMNRKKTDVIDCQWIQKLHSLGLLNRCFLPDSSTEILRTLCRQRSNVVACKADSSRKMQKFLKFLNFRLDVVVNDITGLTGITIIEAITKGEVDPKVLASKRHHNCRKSEEEIAKALVGNNQKHYIFGLSQEFDRYKFYLNQMQQCDVEIAELLNQFIEQKDYPIDDLPSKKPHKRLNKNSVKTIDLNVVSYQYYGGVDLLEIPGVSYSTILSLMSELGPEGISEFPTAKHFTSWLRLAPNNKISGGRTISSKVPRGSNRLKIALRNAAYSISRLKGSPLHKFYKKIAFKKGGIKAITATARKLAVIIWNMLTKKIPYQAQEQYLFLDQKRKQIVAVRKKMAKFGIDPNELGIFRTPADKLAYEKRIANKQ